MPPENTAPEPNMVDGGTPTAEEARLAAQIDTIGDDPQAEPEDGTPKPDDGDAGAGKSGEGANADAGGEDPDAGADAGAAGGDDAGAPGEGGDDDAAVAASTAPDQAAAKPTAIPAVPVGEEPQPPMDFEAEYAKNQKAFDDGECDAQEFQARLREISREESAHMARTEIYKDRLQTAQQRAAAEFQNAAKAWEAKNEAFMANPLYAEAMQQAIAAIDKREPGLTAEALLQKAEKAAFEFTRYTPPAAPAATDEATKKAALAAARKQRTPGKTPATLGGAPTAALVDASAGNSAYAELDSMDIDALENKLARMKPDDVEKYLADAPGAKATGQ